MPPRSAARSGKTKTPKEQLRPWPEFKRYGANAMKWQVWLGHQLRSWRLRADYGDAMAQKVAVRKSGIKQKQFSEIEWGRRRVAAVELWTLAEVYGKTPSDVAKLFRVPTADEWSQVTAKFERDRRFAAPPSARERD
jgi:hypothetical protein